MVVMFFLVICILFAGFRLLAAHAGGWSSTDVSRRADLRARGSAAVELISYPDRVQDRWTALDDRQLTRLLDDNAPC